MSRLDESSALLCDIREDCRRLVSLENTGQPRRQRSSRLSRLASGLFNRLSSVSVYRRYAQTTDLTRAFGYAIRAVRRMPQPTAARHSVTPDCGPTEEPSDPATVSHVTTLRRRAPNFHVVAVMVALAAAALGLAGCATPSEMPAQQPTPAAHVVGSPSAEAPQPLAPQSLAPEPTYSPPAYTYEAPTFQPCDVPMPPDYTPCPGQTPIPGIGN